MDEKYNYTDFTEFLRFPYCLKVGRTGSVENWLEYQLRLIDPYSKYIPLYHSVKCERLEFFYFCFKSVCAIDYKLFQDLTHHGWRGIVWASWISCITPYPEQYMSELLENVDHDLPHNRWLVEIALNILAGDHKNEGIYKSMERFQDYMRMIPRIEVPLRPWYSAEDLRQRNEFRDRLKNTYKSKGTEAALKFFRRNKSLIYDVDYKTWVQNLSK